MCLWFVLAIELNLIVTQKLPRFGNVVGSVYFLGLPTEFLLDALLDSFKVLHTV